MADKNPEGHKYKIKLVLPNGGYEIFSPIPADQFYKEMNETISQKSSDINWTGWFGFRKLDGKFLGLNIRMVIGVEEV